MRVVGQDDAIQAVPIPSAVPEPAPGSQSSFGQLYLSWTYGVGKTELARTLAEFLLMMNGRWFGRYVRIYGETYGVAPDWAPPVMLVMKKAAN